MVRQVTDKYFGRSARQRHIAVKQTSTRWVTESIHIKLTQNNIVLLTGHIVALLKTLGTHER